MSWPGNSRSKRKRLLIFCQGMALPRRRRTRARSLRMSRRKSAKTFWVKQRPRLLPKLQRKRRLPQRKPLPRLRGCVRQLRQQRWLRHLARAWLSNRQHRRQLRQVQHKLLLRLRQQRGPLFLRPRRQFRLRLLLCQLHLSQQLRHLRARRLLYRPLLPSRWLPLHPRRNRQQLFRFVRHHRPDSPPPLLGHHVL